jgi:hypothetical protein
MKFWLLSLLNRLEGRSRCRVAGVGRKTTTIDSVGKDNITEQPLEDFPP